MGEAATNRGRSNNTGHGSKAARGPALARAASHLGWVVQAVVCKELLDLSQHAAKRRTVGVHGCHGAVVARRHPHLAEKVVPAEGMSSGGSCSWVGASRAVVGKFGDEHMVAVGPGNLGCRNSSATSQTQPPAGQPIASCSTSAATTSPHRTTPKHSAIRHAPQPSTRLLGTSLRATVKVPVTIQPWKRCSVW